MKNFKQVEYANNRNSLRNAITNKLKEPIASIIEGILKNKAFIKNKKESHDGNSSKLFYVLSIANKPGFISLKISLDNLITLKVSYKEIKEIKTRDHSEIVSLIKSTLFS